MEFSLVQSNAQNVALTALIDQTNPSGIAIQNKIPKNKKRDVTCVTEYRGTFFSGTHLQTWKIDFFVMHCLQIFFPLDRS